MTDDDETPVLAGAWITEIVPKAPPEEPRHSESASLTVLREMRAAREDRVGMIRKRIARHREELEELEKDLVFVTGEEAELARDIEALELMHDRWAAEAGG